ncbi:MAG TPA: hypothetical protein C5S37_14860, partial [Methanophagales archaeon]|nr:hypothetical protein [Methanophagales archaeon]
VIVKINRQLFSKYGIKEYVVKEYLGKFPEDIAAPEDDEIILVKEDGSPFPKEIIGEVISEDEIRGIVKALPCFLGLE